MGKPFNPARWNCCSHPNPHKINNFWALFPLSTCGEGRPKGVGEVLNLNRCRFRLGFSGDGKTEHRTLIRFTFDPNLSTMRLNCQPTKCQPQTDAFGRI